MRIVPHSEVVIITVGQTIVAFSSSVYHGRSNHHGISMSGRSNHRMAKEREVKPPHGNRAGVQTTAR